MKMSLMAMLFVGLSVTLADEMTLKRGVCVDPNVFAKNLKLGKMSNYHCELSSYYCAFGEEWLDPIKTVEEGINCNFPKYDKLAENHDGKTQTIKSTIRMRDDIIAEPTRVVSSATTGIVNPRNTAVDSPPYEELTKKSLLAELTTPNETLSTEADETTSKRGACVDSNLPAQSPKLSNMSNYHCELSSIYCAVGEEWLNPFKTAKQGYYCNFSSVPGHDQLIKEPDTVSYANSTKMSNDRILRAVDSNSTDCNILANFYNSTGGAYWTNNDDWLSDTNCCDWEGITCTEFRVRKISLGNNNVSGFVPSEIGGLSKLEELVLTDNIISGTIPTEVGDLTKVKTLKLNKNKLTGVLPTHVGDMAKLKNLYLGINSLNGTVPCQVWEISSLRVLALKSNEFTGDIKLSDNKTCTDNGSSRMKRSKLKFVDVSNNKFTGHFPTEFGRMHELRRLYVSQTRVKGHLPTELGELKKLTKLKLNYNKLKGSIPDEVGVMSNLVSISLKSNKLSGLVPAPIGDLSKLKQLTIGGNDDVGGDIPNQVCDLDLNTFDGVDNCVLKTLYDRNGGENWVKTQGWLEKYDTCKWETGSDASRYGVYCATGELYILLIANNLTGSIPSEIGKMTNVRAIFLDANNLEDTIPTEVGNMGNIQMMGLGGNKLSGTIPSEIGKLSKLFYLDLKNNALTGTVPPEVCALPRLKAYGYATLYLEGNDVVGC